MIAISFNKISSYIQEVKGKTVPHSSDSTNERSTQELVSVSLQSACRLPILSARRVVTFPAEDYHCPLVGTTINFESLASRTESLLTNQSFDFNIFCEYLKLRNEN